MEEMVMKTAIRILSASISVTAALSAQAANAQDTGCAPQQQAMQQTAESYQREYEGYGKEGEDLKNDAVKFDADVTWQDTEIIFDLPTATMRNQDIIIGVPQTTLKQHEMRFGAPGIRMVRHKTGQYPETTCHDTWIHAGPIKTKGAPSCTVTWHDIFVDFPEPYVQQIRTVFGVPEFKWDNTRVVMGIPEISMQRQRWVIGIPQFTVRSVIINPGPVEQRSEDLQNRIAETRKNQQREMVTHLGGLYSCYRTGVTQKRTDTSNMFQAGITQLDTIIASVRSQGGNPAAMSQEDGTVTDFLARREELIRKRDEAVGSFDKALADLDASEKTAIAGLSGNG
jgi:hypothetical protein